MRVPIGKSRVVGALAALLVVLVVFSFLATSGAGAQSPGAVAPASSSNSSLTAEILFNGVNVSSHSTPGSAIQTSFSGSFSTVFQWSTAPGTTGARPAWVTAGSISIRFFGASIASDTESVAQRGNGTITLHSDFSQNQYLYEGVYEVHAAITDNGSTLLSQDFYVWVQATDHLTVVNIVLVIIVVLEIYQIAALARLPKGAGGKPAPPAEPPASPAPSESTDSAPPPTGGQ